MKVLVLIMSIYFLFTHVKAIRGIFKTKEKYQKEFVEAIDKATADGTDREKTKGFLIVAVFLLSLIELAFYIITANVLAGYALVMVAVLVLGHIRSTWNGLVAISTEEIKITWKDRVFNLCEVAFMSYFIYFYFVTRILV